MAYVRLLGVTATALVLLLAHVVLTTDGGPAPAPPAPRTRANDDRSVQPQVNDRSDDTSAAMSSDINELCGDLLKARALVQDRGGGGFLSSGTAPPSTSGSDRLTKVILYHSTTTTRHIH